MTFKAMKWCVSILLTVSASSLYGQAPASNVVERGKFILHIFEQPTGEEHYEIQRSADVLTSRVDFKFTDRGRDVPLSATLRTALDSTPQSLEIKGRMSPHVETDQQMEVKGDKVRIRSGTKEWKEIARPPWFFAMAGYAPVTLQMLMMRYWMTQGSPKELSLANQSTVRIEFRGTDEVEVDGQKKPLSRYSVHGLIWGGETLWLDKQGNLISLVSVDTDLDQFEAVREGYEAALGTFVSKAGADGMAALAEMSHSIQGRRSALIALVGGTLIDGTGTPAVPDAVVLVSDGRIRAAGPRADIKIPKDATVIDVAGKTILPGLWDMHAHVSQVEWGPIYLAAGVTTARDCGNEFEFITAVRDAVAQGRGLGPHLLLAGIVDGSSPTAVGVARVDTAEQARAWTDRYHDAGFQQMKIYNSVKLEGLKAVAAEAHRLGMTVTGHVPRELNGYQAIEAGQDQINHIVFIAAMMRPPIPSTLTGPDRSRATAQADAGIDLNSAEAQRALSFLRDHHTVVDPTLSIFELDKATTANPPLNFEPGIAKLPPELSSQLTDVGPPSELSELRDKAWQKEVQVVGALHRAGVPVVAGTDQAVPGYSIYRELELYVKAGFTPMEAIQAATNIPARVMGVDREVGTIEKGKRADLIIVDRNPLENISNLRTVESVMTGGVLYSSSKLWPLAGFKP